MEHRPKRPRLAKPFGRPGRHSTFHSQESPLIAAVPGNGGQSGLSNRAAEVGKAQAAPAPTPAVALHQRQELPSRLTVSVESVIDIVIAGESTVAAEFTVGALPTGPIVLSLPGSVSVTIPALFTPTIKPAIVAPIPTLPVTSILPSISIAANNLNLGSSQVVLSSPPPTPLPTTSSMSLPTITSSASVDSGQPTTGSTRTDLSSAIPTLISGANVLNGNSTTPVSQIFTAAPASITGFPISNSTQGGTTFTNGFATLTGSLDSVSTTSVFHSGSATGGLFATSSPSAVSSGNGNGNGNGVGGSGVSGGSAGSTPSSTVSPGTAAVPTPVQTPVVVGGVVGGLAGLTIFLVLILFLLRWRRTKMVQSGRLVTDNETAPPGTAQSDVGMMQNAAASGGFPLLKRLRPYSGQTTATTDTTTSTERGFQRVGGRKLESVLLSGGDGYGGTARNMSNTSFYRESNQTLNDSLMVGPGSPPMSPGLQSLGRSSADRGRSTPPISPRFAPGLATNSLNRDSTYSKDGGADKEVVTMRPGPRRMIVTSPGGIPLPNMNMNMTPPPTLHPDPLGRSHPSRDGSRGSKFAEDLG